MPKSMSAFLRIFDCRARDPAQRAVEGVAATGVEDDLGGRLGQILDLELLGPVAALFFALAHHVELVLQRLKDRLDMGRQMAVLDELGA